MNSILILLFLCISVLFSMFGLGGGVFYVPILLNAGVAFHQAVSTSLAIMAVMSLTAALIYNTKKLIDWHIILILEPATMIGAFIGSYNSKLFPARVLEITFAIVMIISSILIFVPQKISDKKPEKKFGVIHKKHKDGYYSINMWYGIPVALIAGFISSILGIGGGFAKVPLMTLVFKTPIKIAAATSSTMIVFTALTGLLGHSLIGNVNLNLLLPLAITVFLGAIIGSRISIVADRKFLNIVLALLQIFVALWLIFK
jgi:uncharacterized membrane protein YfcA